MEIREVMTKPVDLPVSTSPKTSIREKFRQEIEQTPEEILGVALEFLLFLKSRTSSESIVKQPPETLPYRPASGKSLVDYQGGWEGDDFEECLQIVRDTRSQIDFSKYQP
ncbi:MAG: hypothetical protein GDA43_15520 [Hormoscilla sp. SP5CHS1]|nr:hypothetical protein [Hormoscilla sp. SP12CHS1]MBC6454428.1 hypothetical protein [Hormoscilla sp. SP5CHS1]